MAQAYPDNERIKRAYFHWCAEAEGLSEVTIGHAGRAIRSYEVFTGHKSFKTFSSKQAVAFCNQMADCPSPTTGKPLSISTRNGTLVLLRSFFHWLSGQPGYRKAIVASDIAFLSLSRSERTMALHRKEPNPFPSCEQIVAVLHGHPVADDLDKRDRAMIAFLLLMCARVASIASIKLKHIDLEDNVAHFERPER